MPALRAVAFRGVTAACLLMVALLGCGPGRTTFVATLPEVPGDYDVDAQPVNLVDLTGLVTGLESVSTFDDVTGDTNHRARAVPGNPLAVRIEWIGGMCEDRTKLTLQPTESGYSARIESDASLVGMIGCPAAGVPRGVIIHTREPIDPDRVGIVRIWS